VLISVPMMKELLYEPSMGWIKAINPYKTPFLTSVMQFYSVSGDG
jgi:hypothetical protein